MADLKPMDLVLFPEFGQPVTIIDPSVEPIDDVEIKVTPIATEIEIDYDNAIDDKITPEMVMRTTTSIGPEKTKSSFNMNEVFPFVLIGIGAYLIIKK